MIFSGETEANLNTAMEKLSMESVSDPGEILNILAESKAGGTAVGILAPSLGSEIYVTAVESVQKVPTSDILLQKGFLHAE